MKILVIHNGYRVPGGDQVVVDQECKLLRAGGHEVVLYYRSNKETESYTGLKQLVVLKQMLWAGDVRHEIADLVRSEKPDIAHIHNTFIVISPSIYSALHGAGVPVVQSLHDYRLFCPAAFFYRHGHTCEECVDHGVWRGVLHACYRESRGATAAVAATLVLHHGAGTWANNVDRFIALTQFAREKFIRAGLPAERISVKPNFIYADYSPNAEHDSDYAIYAGRLAPEKGVDVLLRAWSKVKERIPLLIVGDGPSLPGLRSLAEDLGLKNIDFAGRLSWDQTLGAMQKARFLLFPSVSYEGFPMTIVEAFACAKSVICTRLGSMPEIVQHGRTGLTFEPGSVDEFADRIDWALANPQELRAMGKEARKEYEHRYSPETNYKLLMGIYQRAMRERNAVG
ncbi:MAG: glycosyltransferase family 4 protein [Acidobacteriales bacterium]|nr:glycosyltransferase family 4 protein [Terriglobales bacterium]